MSAASATATRRLGWIPSSSGRRTDSSRPRVSSGRSSSTSSSSSVASTSGWWSVSTWGTLVAYWRWLVCPSRLWPASLHWWIFFHLDRWCLIVARLSIRPRLRRWSHRSSGRRLLPCRTLGHLVSRNLLFLLFGFLMSHRLFRSLDRAVKKKRRALNERSWINREDNNVPVCGAFGRLALPFSRGLLLLK